MLQLLVLASGLPVRPGTASRHQDMAPAAAVLQLLLTVLGARISVQGPLQCQQVPCKITCCGCCSATCFAPHHSATIIHVRLEVSCGLCAQEMAGPELCAPGPLLF